MSELDQSYWGHCEGNWEPLSFFLEDFFALQFACFTKVKDACEREIAFPTPVFFALPAQPDPEIRAPVFKWRKKRVFQESQPWVDWDLLQSDGRLDCNICIRRMPVLRFASDFRDIQRWGKNGSCLATSEAVQPLGAYPGRAGCSLPLAFPLALFL